MIRAYISILLYLACPNLMAGSLTDRLTGIFDSIGNAGDEILDPEQAFRLSSDVTASGSVRLRWEIEDGYYLYKDKFRIDPKDDQVSLGDVLLPAGTIKEDPVFGRVEINTGLVEVDVPILKPAGGETHLELVVGYQGCKEDSVCYPPIQKTLSFLLPAAEAGTDIQQRRDSNAQSQKISAQDVVTKRLSEGGFLANLVVFFGFGLLLSLTPCVFPMIPILSGVIIGQGEHLTTRRAFLMSLIYVLAMAATYAVLGVIAGSFHLNLQAASQNPWVISGFSLVFVLLALSMFGFYELQLPAGVQNRLNTLGNRQRGGTLHGVGVMGVLSAIIVGPCVAPPLAGALLYISHTGDALLGGLALFFMGLGFGVPLLILGASAGKLLPRAGYWMDTVKSVFGVVMLGVAIWFMGRILPGPVTLLLWAVLLIVSSIYMGVFDRLEPGATWQRLWKGLGLVVLVYGVMVVIGASVGGNDVLRPIPKEALFAATPGQVATEKLSFKIIKDSEDLNRELVEASLAGRAVMLDFYADWCVVCHEMEKYTFSDPGVQTALKNVTLLKADVTANDERDKALLERFNLFGPPAILFFSDDTKERTGYRLVGFVEADTFLAHVLEATSL